MALRCYLYYRQVLSLLWEFFDNERFLFNNLMLHYVTINKISARVDKKARGLSMKETAMLHSQFRSVLSINCDFGVSQWGILVVYSIWSTINMDSSTVPFLNIVVPFTLVETCPNKGLSHNTHPKPRVRLPVRPSIPVRKAMVLAGHTFPKFYTHIYTQAQTLTHTN